MEVAIRKQLEEVAGTTWLESTMGFLQIKASSSWILSLWIQRWGHHCPCYGCTANMHGRHYVTLQAAERHMCRITYH
jgi:hypothetical protein